jgi:hypothetical protein
MGSRKTTPLWFWHWREDNPVNWLCPWGTLLYWFRPFFPNCDFSRISPIQYCTSLYIKKIGAAKLWWVPKRQMRPKHTSIQYMCIVHRNRRTLIKISTVYKIICAVCGFCRREVLVFIEEKPWTDHAIFLLKLLCFCLYLLYKSEQRTEKLQHFFMLPPKLLIWNLLREKYGEQSKGPWILFKLNPFSMFFLLL